jgi:hypothetical protein
MKKFYPIDFKIPNCNCSLILSFDEFFSKKYRCVCNNWSINYDSGIINYITFLYTKHVIIFKLNKVFLTINKSQMYSHLFNEKILELSIENTSNQNKIDVAYNYYKNLIFI